MEPAQSANPPLPPAVPTPRAVDVERVPHEWPGKFGVYKYSKLAVKNNLATIVLLGVILLIVSFVAELIGQRYGGFLALIVSGVFNAALIYTLISSVRDQKVDFGAAISRGVGSWWQIVVLMLLVDISYVVSLVLLIIPFFFVFPRLSLATYFLVDKRMGVLEAYKASWEATKGNAAKVWGIVVVNILIGVLAITIIGIPFTIYFFIMYSGAYAVLYELLQTAKPAAHPSQSIPVPNPVALPKQG